MTNLKLIVVYQMDPLERKTTVVLGVGETKKEALGGEEDGNRLDLLRYVSLSFLLHVQL